MLYDSNSLKMKLRNIFYRTVVDKKTNRFVGFYKTYDKQSLIQLPKQKNTKLFGKIITTVGID